MRLIRTTDAVGQVLCHDMTQIIPGVSKDARFRKGHIVTVEDIPVLLSMGKENIYIWEKQEGMLHENEAAELLCELCESDGMLRSEIKEGKLELAAAHDGLLKVDVERLAAINGLDEIMIATIGSDIAVKRGEKLAAMRVIPLVIARDKLERALSVAGSEPILRLLAFERKKCGIVTTGNEVKSGRISDGFTPVVEEKLREAGGEVIGKRLAGDDPSAITEAIRELYAAGAELVVCTGGMSVDPDDRTPAAIRDTGAQIISYGAPVLPGAMFLIAYLDGKPLLGLPGCVMYSKRTIFDLILPRVMANDPITKQELARLGNGGMCRGCDVCHFPNCGFGRGA